MLEAYSDSVGRLTVDLILKLMLISYGLDLAVMVHGRTPASCGQGLGVFWSMVLTAMSSDAVSVNGADTAYRRHTL